MPSSDALRRGWKKVEPLLSVEVSVDYRRDAHGGGIQTQFVLSVLICSLHNPVAVYSSPRRLLKTVSTQSGEDARLNFSEGMERQSILMTKLFRQSGGLIAMTPRSILALSVLIEMANLTRPEIRAGVVRGWKLVAALVRIMLLLSLLSLFPRLTPRFSQKAAE